MVCYAPKLEACLPARLLQLRCGMPLPEVHPAPPRLQVLRVLRPGALEASRRAVPSALAPPPAPALAGAGFGARPQDVMGRAKHLAIGELQTPQPRKDGCAPAPLAAPGALHYCSRAVASLPLLFLRHR